MRAWTIATTEVSSWDASHGASLNMIDVLGTNTPSRLGTRMRSAGGAVGVADGEARLELDCDGDGRTGAASVAWATASCRPSSFKILMT